MTEQAIPTFEDDEISLLDLLVTLAESYKLLLFGPLVAGVLAGGLSFLWPKTFESVSLLRLAEEEAAVLHAAPVLDPLIDKFGLLADAQGFRDDARQGLKKRLTFVVDKKNKLLTITTKGFTPDEAQALNSSAIEVLLKELQVKGKEAALINETIAINHRAILVSEEAIESVQRGLKKGGTSDEAQESAIKNLSVINVSLLEMRTANAELRQKLEAKGAEVLVQQPSLPQRKVSPKSSLVVVLTVLASGFALLLFVFIRKAWASATLNAESADKILAIKRSLGLLKAN